jgi:hypothetical protein
MIDGTGADTLFGMMPPRFKRIGTQYASLIPLKLRKAFKSVFDHLPFLSDYTPIIDFDEPEDLLRRWRGWTKKEIESLCHHNVSFEHTKSYQIYHAYPRNAHLERYSHIIKNMSDDRNHEAARYAGLLCRFPYWDFNLERFVHSLDERFLYKAGEEKRLLKSVLRLHLPRHLDGLKKDYMIFPFATLMRNRDFYFIKHFLTHRHLAKHGLFDLNVIENIIYRFMSGDNNVSFRLWAILIFQIWYESHFP